MLIRLTLLILLVGSHIPAHARDYVLELIVFKQSGSREQLEESWTADSNRVQDNWEKLQSTALNASDQPLRPGSSRLSQVENNLRSAGHQILQAVRWQQPASVYQNAPIVDIGNGPMSGFIRVYKTSLIYADLHLGLRDSFSPTPTPLYFIDEKRRLKFKEVHYFDHPHFGAILTVWPAEG